MQKDYASGVRRRNWSEWARCAWRGKCI